MKVSIFEKLSWLFKELSCIIFFQNSAQRTFYFHNKFFLNYLILNVYVNNQNLVITQPTTLDIRKSIFEKLVRVRPFSRSIVARFTSKNWTTHRAMVQSSISCEELIVTTTFSHSQIFRITYKSPPKRISQKILK